MILTTRMKVAKVEPSRRVKGRILIYFEEGNLLKATEKEVLEFSLYPGRVLSEEEELCLIRAAGLSRSRARAAEMVGARALSRKELCRRLVEKGESEENAAAAADWLEEIGALDDLGYAKSVAWHYTALGYGPAKLRDEFYRRGIPRDLWEEAMAAETGDSTEAIDRYIAAKLRGKVLDEKLRRRVCDGLRRRGFAWEDIKSALRRMDAEYREE